MAGTLESLRDLFDAYVGEGRDGFSPETKLTLLNSGARAAWLVLVGWEAQQNWFVKRSQSVTPGQVDYFPPITTAVREYALPPEFHQLRAIEPDAAGDAVSFKKGRIDDEEFISMRRKSSSGNATGLLRYDIEGSEPGTMIFDTYPPVNMTISLAYIAKPTPWALASDSTGQFPEAVLDMVADWAANRALLSSRQGAWQAYTSQWNLGVQRWAAAMRRDNTAEDIVRGFGE